MNMRNISAWSIRNPVIPIVFFIGLCIAGIVSFIRMDVNQMPDVEFPAVIVSISQPGAAPTEIETQITQKVEAAARSISGVEEISSTAAEGNSQSMVQFSIGTDIDDAVNEVKNAVDQIRGDLPDGILEPRVFKVEAGGGGSIAYFAVSADDMTIEQLSWFIDDTVSKRLLSIEGVAPHLLDPRQCWADTDAYDIQATKLVDLFRNNFKKFGPEADAEAGPQLLQAAE